MKVLFSSTPVILLARIFLGGVFIAAGLDKITDVQAFANSILHYKVVVRCWQCGRLQFFHRWNFSADLA